MLKLLGTECLYAPQPPSGSNIEMVLADDYGKEASNSPSNLIPGKLVHKHTYAIDSTIIYQCIGTKHGSKTKFTHDYNQMNVSATCLKENQWKVPSLWGKCDACKFVDRYV